MNEPIPVYAQEAYAILFNHYGNQPFTIDYLMWFLSKSMTKKILHILERKGWIKRVGRGRYSCQNPEDIIKGLIDFKVPDLLKAAKKKYCYHKASAVEIFTDFSYIQRSWEHSPYFIRVLKKDSKFWIRYFRGHEIPVFIKEPRPCLGEFVILSPEKDFEFGIYADKPIEGVEETIKFCEKNIDIFEYPLAYLVQKFHKKVKTKIDHRILEEVKR